MSKLLKAVEKAKRNKRLKEEQSWIEKGQSHVEPVEAGQGSDVLCDDVVHPDAEGAGFSASRHDGDKGRACPVPRAFYQDDLILDEITLAKNRVLTRHSSASFTDIYNLLRTQILHRTKKKGHNVLMVTSAMPGEGKTITSINLAISIAREVDQFALLVDTDMRNPSTHKYLGIEVEKGLSDHLLHNVPVPDLLVKPGINKLSYLPAGDPIRGSTEILGSPKLQEMIKEMKERYPDRYVVFDCPDLLHAPDALVFSSYVDGIIFVVEAGKTSREHVQKAMSLLEGRNIVGVVLNKTEKESLDVVS
ncbi:polysaccharide biosynthesis tyrosine autokinase [Maridesulfovibrio hydrothermalis]|uniref:non-specific protein-tyrosine kinase n=1 Tax=Maridesulfovibrio hydrothermalis AM13 = DSM 14728 TaxID=1121451 RepID=L0RF41_9BACT|nr:polysaccharide biosynthesis tyrosine autokinase [Maridesulfovibrio hydrothermalis]CCO24827.1 Capsular exopolysaccharide family [Maridesulfovibrio hydrothermalis AM13 = DSM 14728]